MRTLTQALDARPSTATSKDLGDFLTVLVDGAVMSLSKAALLLAVAITGYDEFSWCLYAMNSLLNFILQTSTPTMKPTAAPAVHPTTKSPSLPPTNTPSQHPSLTPSNEPTTKKPSDKPTSKSPTASPTDSGVVISFTLMGDSK
jgi:hypothetical protein